MTNATVNGKPCKIIKLAGLDLRPDNGPDVRMVLKGIRVSRPGDYTIGARYTVSEPEALASDIAKADIKASAVISDLQREPDTRSGYRDNQDFSWTTLSWTPTGNTEDMQLMISDDRGATWSVHRADVEDGRIGVNRLEPNRLYAFKLRTLRGPRKGDSNVVWYHSGKINVKDHGVAGDGTTDDTEAINKAIDFAASIGGGTLLFPAGDYPVRTVHLKSNVWLLVDSGAVIKALPGGDAPELTWFSDRDYRSGLSPTDPRPYSDPENYMTKQDVGHTYFHNSMFHGERIENVKIVGRGRITGNGNLVTGDKVMNNAPDKRSDKMFTFKLCRNIEIGGPENDLDMWYDEVADEPYYIDGDRKAFDRDSMLHIDQGGHFVLLATGTDGIYVHDTYFGNYNTSNARDIYDFMACNDVKVRNIYSKVSSDDIVKPGSDCSLGFTRPARNYMVRNIVGDTNCNLFQIGSETADDIQDLYVDNIYVLGANKAGFSISTNDGAHVKNVYLNSGKTGPLHHRSVMKRTRAPFFISISNRGRVLGADVEMFTFTENGAQRKELLVTNSNIGRVENIYINGVDIDEVYGGSSFRKKDRWTPYDGSQNEATPIIAGFKLPDSENVEGGLTFMLPDGRHTGYITNVNFTDVDLTVKGGHDSADAEAYPPEIGVGRYNVGDLKVQPSFGYWFRHVDGLTMDNCRIKSERPDGRHAIYLDDVAGASITNIDVAPGITDLELIKEVRPNYQTPRLAWGKNHPVGTPRGINPGRVVWTHAPGAAKWQKGEGRWYEDQWNNQDDADWMVATAIVELTGAKDQKKAWEALFKDFNKRHHGKAKGYKRGQKVAVKLNLNNTFEYADNEQLNASPHLALSLLRSLVNEGGVPQECITFFDASRFMTDALFNKCHAEFPNVIYVDNEGTSGRTKATYTDDAIPYSQDNGKLARGLSNSAIEADYLINMALLKGHGGQGVTLCAKNWYGATDIHRNFRKNQHNNFNQDRTGRPRFMTFTDYMGHKDLGEKTMLFLIDGLYGSKNVNGAPSGPWRMAPFYGEWPCSLLASQDGVAIDAVGIDFLSSEFPTMADVEYCDMYLVEAAMADDPLSGTFYDPERDGTGLMSLGVLEHWNNPLDKQYTRNLGTGDGIELRYVKKP